MVQEKLESIGTNFTEIGSESYRALPPTHCGKIGCYPEIQHSVTIKTSHWKMPAQL